MIKVNKLKKGDTIAVLCCSWGGAFEFPHVYKNGINKLKRMGFRIIEYPSTKKSANFLYKNPEFRAKEINHAFSDKEISAIISCIGGDDSIRILRYLDNKIIINNPKIIMGFSDFTTVTTHINQLGLITFNGPQVMAGIAQADDLGVSFQDHLINFLTSNTNYQYKPFPYYTNGYKSWKKVENSGKIKEKIKNEGRKVLQGEKKISGKLFGGCLEVFEFLKGTKHFPSLKFFKGKILFLEISSGEPISINQLRCIFRNYCISGIFQEINGLLIGRIRNFSKEQKKQFSQMILEVVINEFGLKNLPIIINLDFGHTDPQWILPLGIEVEFDIQKMTFKLKESCFL